MQIHAAIIGMQKCGTSSLLSLLTQHPEIKTHYTLQWPYFLHNEEDFMNSYNHVCATYFKNINEGDTVVVRDFSLAHSPKALTRLRKINPEIKIIISLRHPTERAYSAFCYNLTKGVEKEEDFPKIIDNTEELFRDHIEKYIIHNYIHQGFYFKILQRIEQVIPVQNIYITTTKKIGQNSNLVCNEVYELLNLPSFDINPIHANKSYKPKSYNIQRFMHDTSILKTIAKKILPMNQRIQILKSIEYLNRSKSKYPPLNSTQREILDKIYENDMSKLSEYYGVTF